MNQRSQLLEEHRDVTRRYFLGLGAAGVAGLACAPLWGQESNDDRLLAEAIAQLEYLTSEARFAGFIRRKLRILPRRLARKRTMITPKKAIA